MRTVVYLTTLLLIIFFSKLNAQVTESFLTTHRNTNESFVFYNNKVNLNDKKNGFVRLGIDNLVTPRNPSQRLHIMGGSILLTKGLSSDSSGSQHGSIYFGNNGTYGMWGIEYNDEQCTGGLNFWTPFTKTNPTVNFNLFLRNDGYVGIGTNIPSARFHVAGNA